MSGVNKVILIGNLGREPEIRYAASGGAVATLNVATTEKYKDKNGEQKEQTEWHRVVIFNEHLVEVVEGDRRGGTAGREGHRCAFAA